MNEPVRQLTLASLGLIIFLLVLAGAGSIALSQNDPQDQPTETDIAISTGTLRILYLESTTPTGSLASPTGTEFATNVPMEQTSLTPTASSTGTQTLPPFTVQCQPPAGWILYTVQPGDNLYRIGLKFRVNAAMLQKANCLGSSTTIISGQKLWVPDVPTSTPEITETTTPRPTQHSVTSTPTRTSDTATPDTTVTPEETPTPLETDTEPTKSEP